ncbi:hypothetical protein OSCT_0922 [Oscillochloris trichoides DG-6]|uniref:Type II CBASS E2 protein domain-containing protein n=1 Tax=Oscillochloris trichoides DG-6 TaxID=765420 RepID=E1IC71_9CHLR|nr:hypothetical protein [Oscillochloris trichoides]EFO81188.1 hypothetical protein OSCT_0922 [Oscillochloris trichoides DG-6]
MDLTTLRPMRWHATWYDQNPARLILEKRAMESRFPRFQLFNDGGQLVWTGKLESNRGNTYEIALYYPESFPNEPPLVFPINPVITVYKDEVAGRLKHQYNDGHLCLYYPGDRTFAANTTAATVVAVAAAWFFAYESWLESGKTEWPGIEAD